MPIPPAILKNQQLSGLFYRASMDLPAPGKHGQSLSSEIQMPWYEKLGSYFFQRVQGPPVRSQHAARLRSVAWSALGQLSEITKHPEHLAHALKVAADSRATEVEREAAISFLEPAA